MQQIDLRMEQARPVSIQRNSSKRGAEASLARELVTDTAALRKAFVASVVLGPPKALATSEN
jgi:hypothetical protein